MLYLKVLVMRKPDPKIRPLLEAFLNQSNITGAFRTSLLENIYKVRPRDIEYNTDKLDYIIKSKLLYQYSETKMIIIVTGNETIVNCFG